MLSIDKALSLYTDALSRGENPSVESFKNQLSVDDYLEFCDLASFGDLLISNEEAKQTQRIFDQLNQYKVQIYDNTPAVANFRSVSGNASEEAKENIDRIFDEEFKDE